MDPAKKPYFTGSGHPVFSPLLPMLPLLRSSGCPALYLMVQDVLGAIRRFCYRSQQGTGHISFNILYLANVTRFPILISIGIMIDGNIIFGATWGRWWWLTMGSCWCWNCSEFTNLIIIIVGWIVVFFFFLLLAYIQKSWFLLYDGNTGKSRLWTFPFFAVDALPLWPPSSAGLLSDGGWFA